MSIKAYPSMLQSWGIFGIAIISMLIFIPINTALTEQFGAEVGMFGYYLLSMSSPVLLAHFLRKKITSETAYPFHTGILVIYALLFFCIIGIQLGLSMPLGSLLPMPEMIKEMFIELSSFNGIFGFLTIVIAAPILEEFIFRGIILDGMLKRYSPIKSILFSSFLFGLVHLNPWQFISAMLIGSFSGWVYYKTRNLSYSIFIHFINNLIPFIAMQFYSAEELIDMEMSEVFGGSVQATIVILVSLFIASIGILLLQKNIKNELVSS